MPSICHFFVLSVNIELMVDMVIAVAEIEQQKIIM